MGVFDILFLGLCCILKNPQLNGGRGGSDVQIPKIYRITDFFEQLPNLDSLFPMQKFILVEPASLPL